MIGCIGRIGVVNILISEVVGRCFVVGMPGDFRVVWVLEDSVNDVRIVIVQFSGCEGGIVGGGSKYVDGIVNGVNDLGNGVKKGAHGSERWMRWCDGGLCLQNEGRDGAVWWESVVIGKR